jgi:hypothetical protein
MTRLGVNIDHVATVRQARRENFPDPTEAALAAVSGGAFNLNHPGCLIFPDHFQCQRWDRIQLSDRENFERFAEGRTPHWSPPAAISALVRLGLLVVALLTLLQLQSLFRLFSFQKK